MLKEAEFREDVTKAFTEGVFNCFKEAWFPSEGAKGGCGDSNPILSILGKGIETAISEGAEEYLKALKNVTIG